MLHVQLLVDRTLQIGPDQCAPVDAALLHTSKRTSKRTSLSEKRRSLSSTLLNPRIFLAVKQRTGEASAIKCFRGRRSSRLAAEPF
jgi:hypothetical protein